MYSAPPVLISSELTLARCSNFDPILLSLGISEMQNNVQNRIMQIFWLEKRRLSGHD
jgi:hypothetical protein